MILIVVAGIAVAAFLMCVLLVIGLLRRDTKTEKWRKEHEEHKCPAHVCETQPIVVVCKHGIELREEKIRGVLVPNFMFNREETLRFVGWVERKVLMSGYGYAPSYYSNIYRPTYRSSTCPNHGDKKPLEIKK